jgi:hypothetical protein
MWRIVRAELRYNRLNFLLFLAFASLGCIYGVYSSMALFIAWLMMFLAVNNWNAFRIKEKRDFQLAQLPVSARKIALARMMMIIIPGLVFITLCIAINVAVDPDQPINIRVVMMLFGIVLAVFSLALMFRDRFIGTKALKQGKAVIIGLGSLLLVANIYSFFVLRKLAGSGRGEPPRLVRTIAFLTKHNPSTSNINTLVFLAVCLTLACLTIVTFGRRRTNIE